MVKYSTPRRAWLELRKLSLANALLFSALHSKDKVGFRARLTNVDK
jgi:hypothetical protein